MSKIYQIKRNILSSTFAITDNGIEIAKLNGNSFSYSMIVPFQSEVIEFKPKGILSKEVKIIKNGNKIGEIEFNIFRTRAKLEIDSIGYELKYQNISMSKFILFNNIGGISEFDLSKKNGEVKQTNKNVLEIISGIYCYYTVMQDIAISSLFFLLIPMINISVW